MAGFGMELADKGQLLLIAVAEACQFMSAIASVAHENKPSLGELSQQHTQQSTYDLRWRAVMTTVALVVFDTVRVCFETGYWCASVGA